ncbi:MAG: hypothetical protein LBT29_09340, partial [Flavobacteriaceae bacterium]|nr:hypothetical protein [Flavobacteriaceae bacterium]
CIRIKILLNGIEKTFFIFRIKTHMNCKIFYSLSIEDIQTVAQQEFGRTLTKQEIDLVVEAIPDRINWYEAISDVLNEKLSKHAEIHNDT